MPQLGFLSGPCEFSFVSRLALAGTNGTFGEDDLVLSISVCLLYRSASLTGFRRQCERERALIFSACQQGALEGQSSIKKDLILL